MFDFSSYVENNSLVTIRPYFLSKVVANKNLGEHLVEKFPDPKVMHMAPYLACVISLRWVGFMDHHIILS